MDSTDSDICNLTDIPKQVPFDVYLHQPWMWTHLNEAILEIWHIARHQ